MPKRDKFLTLSDMGDHWRGKLRRLLKDRDMTQTELAERIGVTQSRISLWINGTGDPGVSELYALAQTLDVPMEWLAADSDDPPPPQRTDEERALLRMVEPLGHIEAARLLIEILNQKRQGGEWKHLASQSLPEPPKADEAKPKSDDNS